MTKPGPAISARSTSGRRAAVAAPAPRRSLAAAARARAPPSARRSSRSRRARGPTGARARPLRPRPRRAPASSRESALAGNGLARTGEQLLERPQLLRGADGDQHVALRADVVRRRGRVEGPVRRAGSRRSPHPCRGGSGGRGSSCPPDRTRFRSTISSKRRSGPVWRRDDLEKRSDLWLQHQLRHLLSCGRVRLDDPVGAGERHLRRRRPRVEARATI